ncbi:MAG TPA: SGNH/GDSL hydrolase family protein [Gemmatimonadaceae bacterium]|jgi:lysophospholipase L1-like esterase|nr:SGNH/GDSL hydrolase family protein [Gemmatimonadaceae bacterium]
MPEYRKYVALGDSMSIDLYPALDVGEMDVAVALERRTVAGAVAPLGAASLFFRNSERHWPGDLGNDLSSLYPGIDFQNLATDGATVGDVFGEQLTLLDGGADPTLMTLTLGGNDLLSAYGSRPARKLLDRIVNDISEAYDFLVDQLRARYPAGTLIIATVYDPSDGTGRIPGVYDDAGKLPLDVLDSLNDHIRALALGTPRVVLADSHARFLGHGVTAPESERWYWKRSLIEPNARGASELRHLWLEALRSVGEPAA